MKFKDDRIKADFKTRLHTIMEIRGVMAADVCKALGIAKSTYSQYMSGRNEAKSDRVHQLAKYFNCSEAWLIGYDVPMERDGFEKKPTVNDDELSDNMKMLIDFVKTVPEDKVELVLKVMQSIVEAD